MSFAKVNFTSTVTPAGGGGGDVAAWKTTAFGDLSVDSGSYGVTYSAGQNGFAHRVVIDTAADSSPSYFNKTQMAFISLDTGKTVSNLLSLNGAVCSIIIKVSITGGDANVSDSSAYLYFGPCLAFGSDTSSAYAGGAFGGVICTTGTGSTMIRPTNTVGRFGSESSLSIDTFSNLNPSGTTDDTLETIQLNTTGMYGNARGSANAGFTGLDLVYGFKKADGTRYHDNLEKAQVSHNQNSQANTVHLGLCIGQRIIGGSPQSKTLDFDVIYLLETNS